MTEWLLVTCHDVMLVVRSIYLPWRGWPDCHYLLLVSVLPFITPARQQTEAASITFVSDSEWPWGFKGGTIRALGRLHVYLTDGVTHGKGQRSIGEDHGP